jgi:hypothetical protein
MSCVDKYFDRVTVTMYSHEEQVLFRSYCKRRRGHLTVLCLDLSHHDRWKSSLFLL